MHRIGLAEGQPVVRHAVRTLLEQEGYEVVLEAADGVDALQGALKLHPDLLITALRLRRLGGLEVLRRLREQRPETKVLVLTEHDSEHVLKLIIQAGASGFVSKQEDLAELRFALQALARDHSYFPGRALASGGRPTSQPVEAEQLHSLSPRELTVLYYLASGYSNKAIAGELSLSDRTVSTHKVRLFRKLNVKNMIELAELARRHDFLGPGPDGETTPTPPWMAGGQGHAILSAILNAIPGGLTINDLEGRLLFVNDLLMKRYATETPRKPGRRISDVDGLTPRVRQQLEQTFLAAVKEQRSFAYDVVVDDNDEANMKHFWGAPILDEQGHSLAMICGSTDISDQEHTFALLRDAKERADATSRAKTAMFAGLAQQLRAPAAALVSALAPLTGDTAVSPQSRALLDEALVAARTLETLSASLNAVAGIDMALPRPSPEPCDAAKITADICTDQQKRRQTGDPAIRVDIDATASAPVWLDPSYFRGTVVALLAHAASHAQHERFDVRLHMAPRRGGQVELQLEISEGGAKRSKRGARAPGFDGGSDPIDVARELTRSLGGQLTEKPTDEGFSLQLTLPASRAVA